MTPKSLFLTWWIKLTNTIQKRLNVSSTQLLYQSAPFQAAILFVSGPLVDQFLTKQNVFAFKYSPIVLVQNQNLSFLSISHRLSKRFLITYSCWTFAGIYHPLMHYCCICQLQHISGDWQNIPSHISSSWPPQDLPGSYLRLYTAAWPFYRQEHHWNPDSHFWDGVVFIFLHPREQKETSWSIGVSGIFTYSSLPRVVSPNKGLLTNFLYLVFQMKDKDATPFLALEKEGNEVKKSDKDSLV